VSDLISYAQNREDVVLWRALRHVAAGTYVEVGANHPTHDSVSRAFYDRGWSGITVEPVPHFAELQRAERPRDIQVEAAVSSSTASHITLHVIPDSGLSTTVDTVSEHHQDAGLEHVDVQVPSVRLDALLTEHDLRGKDIHFVLVDVEGAEGDVLDSIDLTEWRPWILVIESTAPNSTEPTHEAWEPALLAQGYEFCLFDGLSRFYVSAEKADELRHDLSYPASVFDDFETAREVGERNQRDDLAAQIIELNALVTHWRTTALARWADAVSTDARQQAELRRLRAQVKKLRGELKQVRASTSWRVTRPLRSARTIIGRR
jgi:FkbM family methyltransferase